MLVIDTMSAISRLLRASSQNDTGLSVGFARTRAKASRVAPGGTRSRPVGRETLRGSRAMLTTHASGKRTVAVIARQSSCRTTCWPGVMVRRPPMRKRALVAGRTRGSVCAVMTGPSAQPPSAVAFASLFVPMVSASRMKNWKIAKAAATP